MAKMKQVVKALLRSLNTKDFTKFIEMVRADPKCLRQIFGEEKMTLLHFMCSINIAEINARQHLAESLALAKSDDEDEEKCNVSESEYLAMLEDFIDEFDADLNASDKNGNTPLHYAVARGNAGVVDVLLKYEDIDVNVENKSGVTPLSIAARHQFALIEKQLLVESGHMVNELEIPPDMRVREFQRMKKKAIIEMGPLKKIAASDKPPSAADAVESVFYIEDKRLKEQFSGVMKSCQSDPLLSALINMMGLCAIRGVIPEQRRLTLFSQQSELVSHLSAPADIDDFEVDLYKTALTKIEKELGKRFKIICVDAEDTSSLKVFVPEPRGLYTNKNTVFIASKGLGPVHVLAAIMHESAHFIMNQIYMNVSQPFPGSGMDNPLREKYEAVVAATQANLKTIAAAVKTPLDEEAHQIIKTVFTLYPPSEWNAELIVRVPQILVVMGPESGHAWLKANTPGLLKYFESEVKPRIEQFMLDRNVNTYLSDIALAATRTTPRSLTDW